MSSEEHLFKAEIYRTCESVNIDPVDIFSPWQTRIRELKSMALIMITTTDLVVR
jgi:hypothetical protein